MHLKFIRKINQNVPLIKSEGVNQQLIKTIMLSYKKMAINNLIILSKFEPIILNFKLLQQMNC